MKKILLFFLLFVGLWSQANAQTMFNARLRVRKIDCNAKIAQVDVDVRAVSMTDNFYMGDANFRFSYDSRVLKRPVLKLQHRFSSEAENGQEYGPQNLNGSTEGQSKGLVSLNLFYTGTGKSPQRLTTDWATIATIQFDIVNTSTASSSQLVWYTPQTFPKTGLAEVLPTASGYDLKEVYSGQFSNASLAALSEACPSISTTTPPSNNNNTAGNSGTNPSNGTTGTGNTTSPNTPQTTDPTANVPDRVVVPTDESDLVIPEGFSPNSDGINDKFVITNKRGIKLSLEVYNRYGGIVYSSADYRNDWDAKSTETGKEVPDGTYFYIVKLADGQLYRKAFTIVR